MHPSFSIWRVPHHVRTRNMLWVTSEEHTSTTYDTGGVGRNTQCNRVGEGKRGSEGWGQDELMP